MKYFAKIGSNNLVEQVIVVNDNEAPTEQDGINYISNLFGTSDTWKQTYTDGTRKNYASEGDTYDATRDAFIQPKPHDSWVLNETSCQWEAPIPYPTDGKNYHWDDSSNSWIEFIH
tara:strand:+ start:1152 stop:1499 length:348 start_codon:yes stop_codon:yes gene_type:complete